MVIAKEFGLIWSGCECQRMPHIVSWPFNIREMRPTFLIYSKLFEYIEHYNQHNRVIRKMRFWQFSLRIEY